MHDESSNAQDPSAPEAAYREIRFRHSRDFARILAESGASLLVSTYQAGKLVVVGTGESGLHLSMHNFQQAMGLALHERQLAVGSRGVVWFLQNAHEFAPRLDPPGRYDACYLARRSFITGNIHGHEMAWVGDELWLVNTLFSCLCTLHDEYSFVPRWQPPFITELAGNDRCHLNGLALDGGRPRFVTVMAASNEPAGWRPHKASGGCILDVDTGQTVSHGLAMPHSPRVHAGRLWVLNSGCGTLEVVDPANGQRQVVDRMPGYTRGLAFCGHFAFVGLSRIRETAVFGGVPIAEQREELKCAVVVLDTRSGRSVAYLEFETGVEEIFDIQVVPGARCASITGPYPVEDDASDVWVVPPPGQALPLRPLAAAAGRGDSSVSQFTDDDVTEVVRSGLHLQEQGHFAHAVEALLNAVAARPNSPHLHNHLGNAYQDLGRQDLAEQSYRQAIAVDEKFAPAHQNLGYLLINFGRLDEGLEHLQQAQSLQPADVNRVMLATALPIVYESADDVARRREHLVGSVDQLVTDRVTIDASNTTVPTNFFSAYAGYDDCDVQRKLARLFRVPQPVAPGRRWSSGKIHVGFLSSHFHDHTIGRLNLGRVKLLDRDKFHVTVIVLGHHRDSMAEEFRRVADRLVEPSGPLAAMRTQIAELNLDVLLFTDIGMNTTTYSLAMSRLAPVQCVTWGHPVTTGYQSLDYFISSDLLETRDAEIHYSERLIRLANLGTYYYRPRAAGARSRADWGLDPERHLYFCAQTLFKMHPDFDEVLAGILRGDPAGDLVLIEGRQPTWTRLLRGRFERVMPDVAQRIIFLPPQPNADFLDLNASADVLVDTLHFGGGNTSYEGLAVGTPIVTLPGKFMRGRITQALYRKMGLTDCVVESPQQYVDLAIRLGVDADYRQAMSRRILDRCGVLFEDPDEVRELERFFTWAAQGGSGTWQPAP